MQKNSWNRFSRVFPPLYSFVFTNNKQENYSIKKLGNILPVQKLCSIYTLKCDSKISFDFFFGLLHTEIFKKFIWTHTRNLNDMMKTNFTFILSPNNYVHVLIDVCSFLFEKKSVLMKILCLYNGNYFVLPADCIF